MKNRFTQEQVDFIITNYKTIDNEDLLCLFNSTFNTNLSKKQIQSKIKQLQIAKRNIQKNYGKYTEEMVAWLKENFEKMNLIILTETFNNKFNTTYTKSAIWHKTYRVIDCQFDRTRNYIPRITWKKEVLNYLKANYNNYTYKQLSELMNEKFKLKTTASSIEHKISRLGLKKSLEARQKQSRSRKCSKFWFKPGHSPVTKKPIGYERIDTNGTVWVKTKDPDVFVQKHRLIYKQHFGEIKEGVNIVFLNGDKKDYRIENLVALTNSELALFNNTKINANNNDDIARVKFAVTKVKAAVFKKRSKGEKNG